MASEQPPTAYGHAAVCRLQVCCNVVVAVDLIDDTLLARGLMPALHRVLDGGMLTPDAHILPCGARVWAQAVQAGGQRGSSGATATDAAAVASSGGAAAASASALDMCRWSPCQVLPMRATPELLQPLSAPALVWSFDLADPPACAAHGLPGMGPAHGASAPPSHAPLHAVQQLCIPLRMERRGQWDATAFWFELDMPDGTCMASGGAHGG